MRERLFGYWILSWAGLISNIIALPIIALIISFGPPLKVANITLAITLGWPAALIALSLIIILWWTGPLGIPTEWVKP